MIAKTVKEIEEEIKTIDDIDYLKQLLDIEDNERKSACKVIKKQIKIIRIEKESLINISVLNRLVNEIPYCKYGYERTKISSKIREEVHNRDNHICQLCNGLIDEQLICHHIVPSGEASLENLITLCPKCHDIIHMFLSNKGYKKRPKQNYYNMLSCGYE